MKIVRKDHERMTGDLNYWREEFLADECSEKAADADIATDAPVNCTTYSESKTDSLQGDTYKGSEFTDHDCVVPSSSPCLCSSTGVHACLAECSSYRHAKTVSERWSLLVGRGACFRCLKFGHIAIQCPEGNCTINGCQQNHHPSLHPVHPASYIQESSAYGHFS